MIDVCFLVLDVVFESDFNKNSFEFVIKTFFGGEIAF